MQEKYKQSQIISNKIKELREALSWNQSDLAARAGITRAALSQIEKGERVPSLIVARKLSNVLGITLEELMGGKVEETIEDDNLKLFWRKFKDINGLSSEDQKKIEEFIKFVKISSGSKEGK
jgi:transcriptional regulator with XRE-family HTH domain